MDAIDAYRKTKLCPQSVPPVAKCFYTKSPDAMGSHDSARHVIVMQTQKVAQRWIGQPPKVPQ
jgi:hypothetical protein